MQLLRQIRTLIPALALACLSLGQAVAANTVAEHLGSAGGASSSASFTLEDSLGGELVIEASISNQTILLPGFQAVSEIAAQSLTQTPLALGAFDNGAVTFTYSDFFNALGISNPDQFPIGIRVVPIIGQIRFNGVIFDEFAVFPGQSFDWLPPQIVPPGYSQNGIMLVFNTHLIAGPLGQALGQALSLNVPADVNLFVDRTAPVLTLNGQDRMTLEAGSVFTDPGVTATDNKDGNITGNVIVQGAVQTGTPGVYELRYQASDAAGNQAVELLRTVEVIDTTPPSIALQGGVQFVTAFGLPYVEPGITATDIVDGDVGGNVEVVGLVNTDLMGTYTLDYSVADSAGNRSAVLQRVVVVADITGPVISLVGGGSVIAIEGSPYEDLGAVAIDNVDGDVTDRLTVVSDVDTSRPGRYSVRFNATDTRGNQAIEVMREVVVRDGTPPVLILIGESEIRVEAGEDYTEQGATATDSVDGDLTAAITVGGEVDQQSPGEYIITYDVEDQSGNRAVQMERRVVVEDTTRPVLQLVGDALVHVESGGTYADAGVTATDSLEGDLAGQVQTVNPVDVRVSAEYTITYNVMDGSGNRAVPVQRRVVVRDTTSPVIQLIGEAELEFDVGRSYEDLGAVVMDSFEGNIASRLVVSGEVNTAVPGDYTIAYNATDSSGNAAAQRLRQVRVVDRVPPVIQLLGLPVVRHELNDPYEDAGAVAMDNVDGDLSSEIIVSNPVDVLVDGTYEVTFRVTDAAGNEAVQIKRVVVVGDTGAPVIELLGGQSVVVEAGLAFVDPGFFAQDRVDGDLTAQVTVAGEVNTDEIGSYILRYNVADSNGNSAIEILRMVEVRDRIAPQVELVGDREVVLELGESYTDQGATARDRLEGDLSARIVVKNGLDETRVGSYEIAYSASDGSGNVSESVIRVVRVVDTTSPLIQLIGEASVVLEAGMQYVDRGAIVTDPVVGDISSRLVIDNPVLPDQLGEYVLRFDAEDLSGNRAETVLRRVTVVDTQGPVLTLDGGTELVLEAGEPFVDPGVRAVDGLDGDVSGRVVVSGFVNIHEYGVYRLTYRVTDNAGNATEAERVVHVRDTVPPVLVLEGNKSYQITKGQIFREPGFHATDSVDGNVTTLVEVSGAVDHTTVGVYELIYTVRDSAGNEAAGQRRTVEVVGDSLPPVVQVVGKMVVIVEAGTEYSDLGAIAMDQLDGDVTRLMETEGAVNINVPGEYVIRYVGIDEDGNRSQPVERMVHVVDSVPPMLTLEGDGTIVLEVGDAYVEPGYRADDSLDGDLTSQVVITHQLDVNRVGQYRIAYNVSDAVGNPSIEAVRIVIVGDTGSPVIRMNGDATVVMDGGQEYVDAGATAEDRVDGDLTEQIVIRNEVDTSRAGVYQVTFNVMDLQGNAAVQMVRTVIVEDNVPPVIRLLGDAEIVVEAGAGFTDPGVEASDNLDGDLSAWLFKDGAVNTEVPGLYELRYMVEDRAGNRAATQVRQVRVQDTIGPQIELVGPPEIVIEAGGQYEEFGARAIDRVEGDLTTMVQISGVVNPAMVGVYEVVYAAQDSVGNEGDTQSRVIRVVDTMPPFVKQIDRMQVQEETPLQIVITAHDNGRLGGELTYRLEGSPEGVSLEDGMIRWTPTEVQGPGSYQFALVVSDGNMETARSIQIDVDEVNVAPVAESIQVEFQEDMGGEVRLVGSDVEGSPLIYEIVSPPRHGELLGNGSVLRYVPAREFNGSDDFTYRVNDGELMSAPVRVDVAVLAVEDAPQVSEVTPLSGAVEDELFRVTYGMLLEASDAVDADGDTIFFELFGVENGTLLVDGIAVETKRLAKGGQVEWLPPTDAHGEMEAFRVRVSDGKTLSEHAALVRVVVGAVADDPELVWVNPEEIVYGAPLGQRQLNATANVPGVFEYEPALGQVLRAGRGQVLRVRFVPDDAVEFNIVDTRVMIDVAKAMPSAEWYEPGDIEAGVALGGSQLNATADVPGVFEYEPALGQVLELREGESFSRYDLRAVFVPKDESNFETVEKVVTITVLPRAPENDAPSILVQPEGMELVQGASGQIRVSAVGLKPIEYQWFKDGEPVEGATSAVLMIAEVEPNQAGSYQVEVRNNLGSSRSNAAKLSVLEPPVLAGGLESGTVNLGASHRFELALRGTAPIEVQWFKDGALLEGSSGTTYEMAAVTEADAGQYYVRLSNKAGELISEPVMLGVNLPVAITSGLRDRSVRVGTDVVLGVEHTGTGPFEYRWFVDDELLPEERSREMRLESAQERQKGTYRVQVSNNVNSASSEAFVNINMGPLITRQPLNQVVNENGSALFRVAVTGTKPLHFQWYYNGEPMEGQTSSELNLAKATSQHAGVYRVMVRNEAGLVESDDVMLTVNVPLQIVQNLGDTMAMRGGSTRFAVEVDGSGPVVYQWYKDGILLKGETSPLLSFENLKMSDAGGYFAEIDNPVGVIRTAVGRLEVVAGPELVQSPQPQRVVAGRQAVFEVIAGGTEPIHYQWYRDGILLEGETASVLELASVSDGSRGAYTVAVSNRGGSIETAGVALEVVQPVALVRDVSDLLVREGGIARFEVTAYGTAPVGYQWFYGGTPIEGANGSAFEIGMVRASDQGLYQVEVMNEAGRVRSREAQLTVSVAPSILRQTEDQVLLAGSQLQLQVSSSGTAPLMFNWYRGGRLYSSGSNNLVIENVSVEDSGMYQVEVANEVGAIRGSLIEVRVQEAVRIVAQPQGIKVNEGGAATFSVDAVGSGELSYLWYHNGRAIDGATFSTLSIPHASGRSRGLYEVDITNEVGTLRSEQVELTVTMRPSITGQPESITGKEGDKIVLRALAAGSPPLRYQWKKEGSNLPSETASVLIITNASGTDSGSYAVVVSNDAGSIESELATVVIHDAIRITNQPVDTRAILGESAVIRVETIGSGPISYQWLRNNRPIVGETNFELALDSVGLTDQGVYQVVIQNPVGSVVSDEVRLSVVQGVQILKQPMAQVLTQGEFLGLNVGVSGTKPLSFAWFRDGVQIQKGDSPELKVAQAQLSDAGSYRVEVTNEGGTAQSDEVEVVVFDPVSISSQPESTRAITGQSTQFVVSAEGTAPLSYQWFFNGTPIVGQTGELLQLENVDLGQAGSYQVVVRNPYGTIASDEVELGLIQPVMVVKQSADQDLVIGEALRLKVAVSGTPEIRFQWYKDGVLLDGKTTSSLILDSVEIADAGDYKVLVENEAGPVESEEMTVVVHRPLEWIQPLQRQRVVAGDEASFEVEVRGSGPIHYAWYFNGKLMGQQTEDSLLFASVGENQIGRYQVVVSNPAGALVSEEVGLTVIRPIDIIKQPASEGTLRTGQSVLLEVVASGSMPIAYQWLKNGQALDGATKPVLELNDVEGRDSGEYQLRIFNEAGMVLSEASTLSVFEPVVFTALPEQLQIFPGNAAVFSATAAGTAPITYQWLFENEPIIGETGASLTIDNVGQAQMGKYRVIASNPVGQVASPEVRLVLLVPASIQRQPVGDVLRAGETLAMKVAASGTAPLSYSWSRDGHVIEGEDDPQLILENVGESHSGIYSVSVSNAGGTVVSEPVQVVVNDPVTLNSEPESQLAPIDSTVTFTVAAAGTAPLTYQWLKNGERIADAVAPVLEIPAVRLADAGSYQVIVRNPAGERLSRAASLRVAQPVSLITQPQASEVRLGQAGLFKVLASGTEPLSYQWYKDGEAITGANKPRLAIGNSAESDGGAYQVVVGNIIGDVASAEVDLTVLLPPSVGQLVPLKEVQAGETVTLTAPVSGYGTFNYQWLKNGVNISGATAQTLELENVSVEDSGSYSLNVGSEGGALYSNTMNLRVMVDEIVMADAFAQSQLATGATGVYRGSNIGATRESGEPKHGGWTASSSVWLRWQSPLTGIVTFGSQGSTFDTTMAVYRGETFEGLSSRGSDTDSGAYLTSEMRFNAESGAVYHIVVDGFNGAQGDIVVQWELEETALVLPVIVSPPVPTSGVVGQSAEFNVGLEVMTDGLTFAWYHDGEVLVGESESRLVLENISVNHAGTYSVSVTSGTESVTSEGVPLVLQFSDEAPEREVSTKLDLGSLTSVGDVGGKEQAPVLGGPGLLPRLIAKLRDVQKMPGEFSFSGSTVYSTVGANKANGEPNHAGVTGGASAWTTYTPTEEGTAKITTDNSTFDTVLAIYQVGSGSGWDALEEVASNDDGGVDGQDSEVVFDVNAGQTYLVAVDGVGGESGTVQLNHELAQVPVITSLTEQANGIAGGSITLEVVASNPLADTALEYIWRRDGLLIDGASQSTLVVSNLSHTDVGSYTVQVSNFAGEVVSDGVDVRVIQPVEIETNPVSVSGVAGGSAVFEVSVVGSDPISYQWKHNGSDVAGGTESALTVLKLDNSMAGEYQVLVTNPAGSVLSDVAQLDVLTPPAVDEMSENQNVFAGNTVELSVTVSGSGPFEYQWKRDGVLVDGATGAQFVLENISTIDAGVYSVSISNSAGTTESQDVMVSVVQGVSIVSQPTGGSIMNGGSTVMTVSATGTEPITYAWYKDGELITNETDAELKLTDVGAATAGDYYVKVANAAGAVDSQTATIIVESPPVIVSITDALSLVEGADAILEVGVSGTPPFTYQWMKDGVLLPDEAGATLSLHGVTALDMAEYRVAVSNASGRVESEGVDLVVFQPAAIVTQPAGKLLAEGDESVLSVTAMGTEPLSYQWYLNGVQIDGQTGTELHLGPATSTDIGEYHVEVWNLANRISSVSVQVEVEATPVITSQPTGVNIAIGQRLELAVGAAGSAPLSYQWFRDGVLLEGATSRSLAVEQMSVGEAGNYSVLVQNNVGQVESTAVEVNAIHPVTIVEQPQGGTFIKGGTVVLEVAATGSEPLNYKWYRNDEAITDAADRTLTIVNIDTGDIGAYSVRVENPAGAMMSDGATITVDSPPQIIELSDAQNVAIGASVLLAVSTESQGEISYQWKKDGVLIEGANGAELALSELALTDSGDYSVSLSNEVGSTESEGVTVKVMQAVAIATDLETASSVLGGRAVFQVAATGSEPIEYVWSRDGVVLDGQTGAQLVIESIGSLDVGEYQVSVSNAVNSVDSAVVSLIAETPPVITKIVSDQHVPSGATVDFWVNASGSQPMTYQWKRDGVAIPNGQSNFLRISSVEDADAGAYTVEIANQAGVIESVPVSLAIVLPPLFVTQPQSKTIGVNSRLVLSVSATGTDLQYQWRKNGEALLGQTGAVLTIPDVSMTDAGDYTVLISNTLGQAESELGQVIVVGPPGIVSHPTGGNVALGGGFRLVVEAVGSGEVTYQWRRNGILIDGETASELYLAELELADAGDYSVEVSNEAGLTLSDPAEVTVLVPVAVTEQPQSIGVIEGDGTQFVVSVSGSNPINYQWYFEGDAIDGATESVLSLEQPNFSDAGNYHVVVSNPVSSVSSELGRLAVYLPPSIVTGPLAQVERKGRNVQFEVSATGTAPLTYQWRRDGEELQGETGRVLSLSQVGADDDAQYSVVVRNEYGVQISAPAKLDVQLPVAITGQPEDMHVAVGDTLMLGVTASGTGPFTYQWYLENEPIAGANEALLEMPNMTRKTEGAYHVEVSNVLGAVESRRAGIVVDEPVNILSQSSGSSVPEGTFVRLWVSVSGSRPFTYQWQKDGIELAGATRPSLTLSNIQNAEEGTYSVIVANPVGAVVTEEMEVKVNVTPTVEPVQPLFAFPGGGTSVQLVAYDGDGEDVQLKLRLENAPKGMRIVRNGLLKWEVPGDASSGTQTVKLTVSDPEGATQSVEFTATVNRAPVFGYTAEQTAVVGQLLTFQPKVSDPDSIEWSLSGVNLPEGAAVSPNGIFTWTPVENQIGRHKVAFNATDPHGASSNKVVIIQVNEAVKEPAVTLYASSTVTGKFEKQDTAVLNEEENTFIVPRTGTMKFFKLATQKEPKPSIQSVERGKGESLIIRFR